jgi:hypothetical protein
MSLPHNLSKQEYYGVLSGCRDDAIERSHVEGTRFRLGWLAMGSVTAEWSTATNGIAVLRDQGLSISRTPLQPQPTQLNFYDAYGMTGGFRIQTFDMDLENDNGINGYTTYIGIGGTTNTSTTAVQRKPIELTLDHYTRIYTEMERGANGAFRCQVRMPIGVM